MNNKKEQIKNNDFELMRNTLEEKFAKRYKTPFWKRVWDVVEMVIILLLIIIGLLCITFLLMTLIEHPVSLAILCATIFLIIIWWIK